MTRRRNLAGSRWDKLQLYQQLMSMESSLLLAYGAVFVGIEVYGLGLAFHLKEMGYTDHLWVIAIACLAIGIIFLVVFCLKANEAIRWKAKILELTKATDMEDDFEPWRKSWLSLYWFGRWWVLIWVVPLFLGVLAAWWWIVFGWHFITCPM